jgi:molybdopterin-guanine dinucleotide biosynthesis protein A
MMEIQCYHFGVDRAGYVLTGGRSSRMGRDKALLLLRGELLGAAVAKAVKSAAGSAMLVGNSAHAESLGYPVISDLYPGEGPLGGILTALMHSTAEWNLVTACDMPELTADFLRGLLTAAGQSGADILMPTGPSGLPEPLCAVYRRTARDGIARAFESGTRKVTAAFAGLRLVHVRMAEVRPLHNVNTPEDWAEYAAG